MPDLNARIKKLEDSIGPPASIDGMAGWAEASRSAVAKVYLHAAVQAGEAASRAGRPNEFDPDYPNESVLAGEAAGNALEAKLSAEGLINGPLDDAQRARVRELAGGMLAELGPVNPDVR